MTGETFDLVVKGGTVVTAEDERDADIGITGGRIAVIAPELPTGRDTIDASGLFVLPGGVDPHVHFSPVEPPPAPGWVDDFWSGSRAAAAGGVTTVGHMTYPWPGQSLLQAIERDRETAARDGIIDFAFHPVLTDPAAQRLEEIPLLAERGHTTLKYFMSFAGFLTDPGHYVRAMRAAKDAEMPVLIHCEDAALLEDAVAYLVANGRTAPRYYAESRPVTVEAAATARAVAFAEQTGASAYIVHLSSEAALDEVRRGRERGLDLSIETRPMYLFLTEERFAEPDAGKYFGQPPLRTVADRDALWQAIVDGEINTLATDHAPWMYADKTAAGLDITTIPPGVADLDVMLPMFWSEGVSKGRISRSRFAEITATYAARLLGIFPRKGTIAEGSDADLVLWDPDETRPVRAETFASVSDYSPYEGWQVTGWPTMTISRGEIIARNGIVEAERGRAQLPDRQRVPRLNLP